jgi:putative aldouronate transport system substrate-binding protein
MWIMYHYAPNNWKVDSSGKLVRAYETDQYKAAVAYARDLATSGVYHPDSPTFNVVSIRTAFVGRKFVFNNSGWLAASVQFYEGGLQQTNPPSKLDITPPFGSDGGKGSFYLGPQLFGWSMIKKAPDARVKEILGLFNFLAAPFGSQEQLLLNYGIEGTDFKYDDKGNPILTDKGKSDNNSLWGYVVAPPQVYYNANNPKYYADMMYNGAKSMIGVGVADPTLGLYSATNDSKGPVIQQQFLQDVSDVIAGRRPLSDFDGLVKTWQSTGGDTIRKEYQDALMAAS